MCFWVDSIYELPSLSVFLMTSKERTTKDNRYISVLTVKPGVTALPMPQVLQSDAKVSCVDVFILLFLCFESVLWLLSLKIA